jgi:hypothetical protein
VPDTLSTRRKHPGSLRRIAISPRIVLNKIGQTVWGSPDEMEDSLDMCGTLERRVTDSWDSGSGEDWECPRHWTSQTLDQQRTCNT